MYPDNWHGTQRRMRRRHNIAMLALVLVFLGATTFMASRAEAHNHQGASSTGPFGGCKEAWQAPRSVGADQCRDKGWQIGARYVVSPRRVLRYYHLPSCRYEDGSGQRSACGWNVVEGDGNGRGRVYLAITQRGDDDRFIMLRVCDKTGCKAWRR